ncbi:hypothetical protein [Succinimonas sp.]|uniref:hypothetical protein n=1 Tax=Succinimonas sp. TaxID=1936151 RepID=UPI003867041A
MKFEFFSYDNDSGKSESLDEFAVNFDWTKKTVKAFSIVLDKISRVCDVKEFNPVVSIIIDDDCVVNEVETMHDGIIEYHDCKVVFDVEINHENHTHFRAECFHVPENEIFFGFYNILRNMQDIKQHYLQVESIIQKPFCDAQKIELLARNIAHYLNGRMYESIEGSVCKCEMIERKFINHGNAPTKEIQEHIFDRYCYSFIPHETVEDELQEMVFYDRFVDYGDYRQEADLMFYLETK